MDEVHGVTANMLHLICDAFEYAVQRGIVAKARRLVGRESLSSLGEGVGVVDLYIASFEFCGELLYRGLRQEAEADTSLEAGRTRCPRVDLRNGIGSECEND
jgi:hypothetical protein